jgi:hypothetical protein
MYMSSQVFPKSSSLAVQAIIGGILGGIIVDAFLALDLHVTADVLESRNAALIAGPGASPLLGVSVHFAIAIVWALIYAYAFNAIGKLRNWILGTIVFGIVVNAVMNFAITTKTGDAWGNGFVRDLIPNVVFYALPVAFYLARAVRE